MTKRVEKQRKTLFDQFFEHLEKKNISVGEKFLCELKEDLKRAETIFDEALLKASSLETGSKKHMFFCGVLAGYFFREVGDRERNRTQAHDS